MDNPGSDKASAPVMKRARTTPPNPLLVRERKSIKIAKDLVHFGTEGNG